ncbi:MCE family protein [Phaeacidiphilus oryzae]|uniref:MCE family protein n=1 Tax=Phaeacidiphilus oryzae TaxID=348818 RepID=UPI0007C6D7D8|nr:MlaD family protein [Phaeacidiphilus oryzae]
MSGPRAGVGVKVLVIVVIGGVLTAGIAAVLGGFRQESTHTYHAVFSSASGLVAGQDVRAAGVSVGQVEKVALRSDDRAEVTFTVDRTVPMTTTTQASIRYQNLVGDRYLQLSPGAAADGRRPAALAPGALIPLDRTAPALDLDELYNGFTPLLQGLAPQQVNQLSGELIEVLQGEGGSVQQLLGDIGSLTSTLADRDRVIGELVSEFDSALGNLDAHRGQLSDLISRLQHLVSGLSQDRKQIGDSLSGVSRLTTSVGGLLQETRPDITGTVGQTDRLAALLEANSGLLQKDLTRLPVDYRLLSRLGAYGQFFNFYLCQVQIMVTGPDGKPVTLPALNSEISRCKANG